MSRWVPGAASRLQEAAIALFVERGFDQTTVAEIAKRAGLTERTFFRYFADKREVLFYGSHALTDTLVKAVDEAAIALAPVDVAAAAVEALADLFDGRFEHSRLRSRIVDAHPDLQERELIKMASLRSSLARALERRGVAESTAALTAELGIAVFYNAFVRWVRGDGARSFVHVARDAWLEIKAVAAGSPSPS